MSTFRHKTLSEPANSFFFEGPTMFIEAYPYLNKGTQANRSIRSVAKIVKYTKTIIAASPFEIEEERQLNSNCTRSLALLADSPCFGPVARRSGLQVLSGGTSVLPLFAI